MLHCLSSLVTSAERQKLLGDEAGASEEEQEQDIADLLVDQGPDSIGKKILMKILTKILMKILTNFLSKSYNKKYMKK